MASPLQRAYANRADMRNRDRGTQPFLDPSDPQFGIIPNATDDAPNGQSHVVRSPKRSPDRRGTAEELHFLNSIRQMAEARGRQATRESQEKSKVT